MIHGPKRMFKLIQVYIGLEYGVCTLGETELKRLTEHDEVAERERERKGWVIVSYGICGCVRRVSL